MNTLTTINNAANTRQVVSNTIIIQMTHLMSETLNPTENELNNATLTPPCKPYHQSHARRFGWFQYNVEWDVSILWQLWDVHGCYGWTWEPSCKCRDVRTHTCHKVATCGDVPTSHSISAWLFQGQLYVNVWPWHLHWASKETYHFFRVTFTEIHCIKMIHIWIQVR